MLVGRLQQTQAPPRAERAAAEGAKPISLQPGSRWAPACLRKTSERGKLSDTPETNAGLEHKYTTGGGLFTKSML